MLIPVRCWTCGKVTGHLWEPYLAHRKNGASIEETLTALGLQRICCRRMLMTHIDVTKNMQRFSMRPQPSSEPQKSSEKS